LKLKIFISEKNIISILEETLISVTYIRQLEKTKIMEKKSIFLIIFKHLCL